MKSPKEIAKIAGATIIVGAAAFIMIPGFLSVAGALFRILLIVVIAGGACLALAHATRHMAKAKRDAAPSSTVSTGSDGTSS